MTVDVPVNGTSRREEIEPRMLLVHFLREQIGLTGTHIGCQTGQCGACTVLIDGEAVKSCMVLAAQAEGHEVTTIEGLAPAGTLHPVQQAFWEEHGAQCGYCTPAMVLSTVALLADDPDPDEHAIRHALDGNICRCTGYHNIVLSVRAAAQKVAAGAVPEPFLQR
ncbi:MAG: (2Fe-2S)-binding protein [Chloroflexia bacterium]|nr:(2Fe-2S)-binding protein [Chloroflexia bacterium]MDQ3512366.1 (2Fe-2S)-binding protein [Chloroflexota bacterium]